MALKKSELYSSLWQSCDELRGGMDASQYKDYVLVLLFVKYVSDKAAGQKGYLLDVPPGGGFTDMVALKGDKEIGDKINKIIGRLAATGWRPALLWREFYPVADSWVAHKYSNPPAIRYGNIFETYRGRLTA